MHDYFDIVGVSPGARPTDIRRVCGRRVHASHPDVRDGDGPAAGAARRTPVADGRELSDAAIDFVDASTLVDAIRAGFFSHD